MPAPDPRIGLEIAGGIARLTLRRPEKRNALDDAMIAALAAACTEVDHSTARVLILQGEGATFCAGGDIAGWSGLSAADFGRRWLRDGNAAFDALARLRQPVIAVLSGAVLGGGLELAACADLRIAEMQATFALPETGLGIIPGWSGTQRAVRRFGVQPVRRMALFGEVLDAPAALSLGVVDRVVPVGAGVATAETVARDLLRRAPFATEVAKMMLNAAEGEEQERVLDALAGIAAAGSADLQEGLAAFRAKRAPRFEGEGME